MNTWIFSFLFDFKPEFHCEVFVLLFHSLSFHYTFFQFILHFMILKENFCFCLAHAYNDVVQITLNGLSSGLHLNAEINCRMMTIYFLADKVSISW